MKVEEYMESFSFDLAEKFCTRALELSPDNLNALDMAASVYLEIGQNEEAAKVCVCAVFCQHRFITEFPLGGLLMNCFAPMRQCYLRHVVKV